MTLRLNTEGLFTQALEYACPARLLNDDALMAGVRERFSDFTSNPNASIYSGYRARVLERAGLEESKRVAAQLRDNFDAMVVMGIGGSALGARTGLSGLLWTVPESQRRRVLIADNLDPIDFEDIMSQVSLPRTCFVVISKSGGTIETMAQLSAVMDRLAAANLPLNKHLVVITDPEKGALRSWTNSQALTSLSVPADVGGRFSVFTPVGLLPLAFAGISVDELIEGAAQQLQNRFIDAEQVMRAGARLAELEMGGYVCHTLIPYATKLRDFAAWFVQLWGESLGKERPQREATGMVPVAAVGATDQHSLLQLLVEGPNRIVTGFIRVEEWPRANSRATAMGKLPAEFANLSYAFNKPFAQILNAEETATRTVLQKRGRPVYEVSLTNPTPAALGALMALYMDLTVYTGAALDLNPFDQPGVELGKRIVPELLGGA